MARTRKQHRSPLVIAFAVAVALLLSSQTWKAARNGLSDLYARPAIDYLENKRYVNYEVRDDEWIAIESTVAYADHLMPGNPQYLEALGWLHQIRLSAFTDELSIEELNVHSNKALDYFHQAVESRPTWPYYWGNLALEQYRRGNYATDEYSLALTNASRFGPWKNDTQRLVADLGTDAWEYLSPQARREIVLNIERGLDRQQDNIVVIVRKYGAWPDVCAVSETMLDITPHLQSLCAEYQVAQESDAS